MTKQNIHIINFRILFDILEEVKSILSFEIFYHEDPKSFIEFLKTNKTHNFLVLTKIIDNQLKNCDSTHLALVHNETTSGILNPIEDIIPIAKKYNKKVIIDAISSYGGIPIDINGLEIDYLILIAMFLFCKIILLTKVINNYTIIRQNDVSLV